MRRFVAALLAAPQRHYGRTRVLAIALCAAPFLVLAWEAATGTLGINPFERLSHATGLWALKLLLVTLAVTPLRRHATWLATRLRAPHGRRLSDWNWLVRLRRPVGLAAFGYAVLHLGVYAGLDVGLDAAAFARDLREKPYILAGATALLLLVPLAATSTDAMVRRLGRHWRRLHRLVYLVGIAAAVHYLWGAKAGALAPQVYAGVLAVLLLDRVIASAARRARGGRDDGMEVPER